MMKRSRTGLSLFLGLMLLVQGFAVSAAYPAMPDDPAAVVVEVDCHGNPVHGSPTVSTRHDCCDTACPDMSTCLLGHLAGTAVIVLPDLKPAVRVVPDFKSARVTTRALITPLRPPII